MTRNCCEGRGYLKALSFKLKPFDELVSKVACKAHGKRLWLGGARVIIKDSGCFYSNAVVASPQELLILEPSVWVWDRL